MAPKKKLIDAIRRNPGITYQELSQIFAIHYSRVLSLLADCADVRVTRTANSTRAYYIEGLSERQADIPQVMEPSETDAENTRALLLHHLKSANRIMAHLVRASTKEI
ncbi:MAG: hypothetical protein LBK01_01305 [Burkholderiaceae bacterium]|jgi:hypothetical protein|nr:hypothetical protein [Burkholderiaceae bacterium]